MEQRSSLVQEEPAPYRFTVKEWHQLGERGFFSDDPRVELLDGEIITMSPIGNRHGSAANNLNDFFGEKNLRRYLIAVGNPIEVDDFSEPLPDFTLLPRSQKAAKRHPFSRDAFLVVEVSDSSLSYDRTRKLRKYAKSGVLEYWIVNLRDDVVEVYRSPQGEKYLDQSVAKGDELVAPLAFPDTAVPVSEIIPAR